jgi:hypothetical protein
VEWLLVRSGDPGARFQVRQPSGSNRQGKD